MIGLDTDVVIRCLVQDDPDQSATPVTAATDNGTRYGKVLQQPSA